VDGHHHLEPAHTLADLQLRRLDELLAVVLGESECDVGRRPVTRAAEEMTPVIDLWLSFHHTFSWIASVSRASMSLMTGNTSFSIAVTTASGRYAPPVKP
jgi:hypothetical protein